MAANSPIMRSVVAAAERGVPVLGVCNGFQVLTEARLLPGALRRNGNLKYICKPVALRVETADSAFTAGYEAGQEITIPIAHHDGNYYADADTLRALNDQGRVAFRYVDNPNGSVEDIAGVLSENRRVLGMMPHPERMAEAAHGGTDGQEGRRHRAQHLHGQIGHGVLAETCRPAGRPHRAPRRCCGIARRRAARTARRR